MFYYIKFNFLDSQSNFVNLFEIKKRKFSRNFSAAMNHQVGFNAFGGDSRVIRKMDGGTSLKTGRC